ncbi:hypothetical protein [Urbifossiella limnaea]|uniref:Uncharacterized protein n=1 Tax=Urbifossiella limnaea TaxID=2528023 RepID=A0A517XW75_9BACT|nr:hypothetical protein [Urbifossiella limnaea]QDU21758.1 hypothetical protein ETAA1_37310 [Urbifossiella limnaea]
MANELRDNFIQAIKAMLDLKIQVLVRGGNWDKAADRPEGLMQRWAYWGVWKRARAAARAYVRSGLVAPRDWESLTKYFPDEAFAKSPAMPNYQSLAREYNDRLNNHKEYNALVLELANRSGTLSEPRAVQVREAADKISTNIMGQLLTDFGLDNDDLVRHAVKITEEATKLLR